LVKRRKRDVYGNWVWEDEKDLSTDDESVWRGDAKEARSYPEKNVERDEREEISLDWRDIVALSIASLETFLLPIVIFILVLVGLVLGLSFFR
jgi:hypothetical protein